MYKGTKVKKISDSEYTEVNSTYPLERKYNTLHLQVVLYLIDNNYQL